MVEIVTTGKISMAAEVMKLLRGQYLFNVPSSDLKFTQAAEPRKRVNQKNLSTPEQNDLLLAWQNVANIYSLGATVAEHALGANHVIHSMDRPPWGTWRFLPWHRFYLYYTETLLQVSSQNPNITIPYWDWTVDQAIPKWLEKITPPVYGEDNYGVRFPITPSRQPGFIVKTLPPPEDVGILMKIANYFDFTQCLEMGTDSDVGIRLGFKSAMHNQVHNWVGGTMSNIDISPADILFWMHHANVDRIWSIWQNRYPDQYPNGLGCYPDPNASCQLIRIPGDPNHGLPPHDWYAWVMDPYTRNSEPECRSIQNLGYSYV
jgi:tyrosinase